MGRVRNIPGDLHRAKAGGSVRAARVSKEDAGNKGQRSGARAKTVGKPLAFSGLKGEAGYEEFATVWDALGFSKQEAANLEARSVLMMEIENILRQEGWTQAQAAKRCGVSQPRISDLLRGNIDKFSLDALVNIAAALGRRVNIRLDAA